MDKSELILEHLERNLGADLKKSTNLPQQMAFQFAQKYVQYLRASFNVPKEENGSK
jgi:hypothetical protein